MEICNDLGSAVVFEVLVAYATVQQKKKVSLNSCGCSHSLPEPGLGRLPGQSTASAKEHRGSCQSALAGRGWWDTYIVLGLGKKLTLEQRRSNTEQVYKGIFHISSQIHSASSPDLFNLWCSTGRREKAPGHPVLIVGGGKLSPSQSPEGRDLIMLCLAVLSVGVRSTRTMRTASSAAPFSGGREAPLLSLEAYLHAGAALFPLIYARKKKSWALPCLTDIC